MDTLPFIDIGRNDALVLLWLARQGLPFVLEKTNNSCYAGIGTKLYYVEQCGPAPTSKRVRQLFGCENFTEVLPVDWLRKVAGDPTIKILRITIKPEHPIAEFKRI